MELFFLFALSPEALPYEIALVILVAGLIFAAYKPEKWKYNLVIALEAVAIIVSGIMIMHFGQFGGLTYILEVACALYAGMAYAVLMLITFYVRSKRKAYF